MKTYKMQEVLEIVGVSRKTLKSWIEKGVAEPGRAGNGYRMFDDEDLRRIVEYKRDLVATTRYTVGVQR